MSQTHLTQWWIGWIILIQQEPNLPRSKTRDSEMVEQMSNMKEVLCPDSKCSWYKYQYVSPLLWYWKSFYLFLICAVGGRWGAVTLTPHRLHRHLRNVSDLHPIKHSKSAVSRQIRSGKFSPFFKEPFPWPLDSRHLLSLRTSVSTKV